MKFWKITFFVVIILGLNQGVCSKDSEEPGDHSEENTTEDETGSAESEDEIMEDQTNLAEREVKSPPSEQEKRATMEKFTKAFLKAMTHGLLLATPAGHFFGMAVAIVSFAVGEATKQGKSFHNFLVLIPFCKMI